MSRPFRVPLLLAIGLFAALPALAQSQDVSARVQRVEDGLLTPVIIAGRDHPMRLGDRMTLYNVPGVSVAVINDGRIEWARGWGVVEAGGRVPVDTATLFQAASISKPVAAMAALRLVEQDQLALDADVNRLLRSWRIPENGFTRSAPVTLRRLLSHNAGLTVHGFRGYARGEAVPTVVQLLDGAQPANSAAVRADTIPGSIWRYSGGGSSVAQLLMEDVTGVPFPRLMRDLVLAPAGMRHSGYEQPLPAYSETVAAAGHRSDGRPVAGSWHTYPEMFAAGLWTTPSDLARLALNVQASFNGGDGILSRAMTRQMLTIQAGDYGLGFGVQHGHGWISFSHGGANEGFRAMFIAFADRAQGAVIMTNGDAGATLAAEIMRSIAREYDWPAHRALVRDVVPAANEHLAEFAGLYTFTANGVEDTFTVTLDANGLRGSGRPFPAPRALHPAGDDSFFFLEGTASLRFQRDAIGRITALVFDAPSPIHMIRN
jgi:CubicO group peptidase (beta-lactamase class C family)